MLICLVALLRLVGDIELQLVYSCTTCRDSVGRWGSWSEWSLCLDNFGVSSQTRTRSCLNDIQCPGGDSQEARQCLSISKDQPLPVQNIWSEWGAWNECNGTKQGRTRGCQCNQAVNLNQCNCVGESFEERACSTTIPVLQSCANCQSSPCAQCPPNNPLPCQTCI